mmetsp:Transcript_92800/g.233292  ORF Transcript_92800/g.233292 Transcript_92800/m.233292 type:complete len:246 (+) Transcript_92800:95-832(+)
MLGDTHAASGGLASPVLRLVRVALFGASIDPFLVFEAAIHHAPVAALVALLPGAIDELLLRQGYEVTRSDLPSPFERAGRREGPARAALGLVFHLGHSALLAPIHGGGERRVAAHVFSQACQCAPPLCLPRVQTEAAHCELVRGHISELVDAKLVAVSLGVLQLDVGVVRSKSSKARLFLGLLIDLSEVLNELAKCMTDPHDLLHLCINGCSTSEECKGLRGTRHGEAINSVDAHGSWTCRSKVN